MNSVPQVSIRRDPRFSLEENWNNVVVPAIKEAQERGVLVTPLTVFQDDRIIGWFLHGWKPPPPIILYECEPPDDTPPAEYQI
jgi:hypothetical protein